MAPGKKAKKKQNLRQKTKTILHPIASHEHIWLEHEPPHLRFPQAEAHVIDDTFNSKGGNVTDGQASIGYALAEAPVLRVIFLSFHRSVCKMPRLKSVLQWQMYVCHMKWHVYPCQALGLLDKAVVDRQPEMGRVCYPMSPRRDGHRDARPRKGPLARGRGQSTSTVFSCMAS